MTAGHFEINGELPITPVIPAQAGIQPGTACISGRLCRHSRAGGNPSFVNIIDTLEKLDSRLRGNDGLLRFLDVSKWDLLKTPSSRPRPGSRGGQVIENTKGLDSRLRRNDEICGFLDVAK